MRVKYLQNLLSELEGPPSTSSPSTKTDLDVWRSRIDLIDRILLELLNERSKSANAIGEIKKELGMAVYVPAREEKVLEQVRKGNRGPLPDSAVRNLFERIIDETRSLERHMFQDHEEDPPQ